MNKTCIVCGLTKPKVEFCKEKHRKNTYKEYCKACADASANLWRESRRIITQSFAEQLQRRPSIFKRWIPDTSLN